MKKVELKNIIEVVDFDDNNVKSTQELSIETDSDGVDWAILTHDREEFSLSLDNLKSLLELIKNGITLFENASEGMKFKIDENGLTELQ